MVGDAEGAVRRAQRAKKPGKSHKTSVADVGEKKRKKKTKRTGKARRPKRDARPPAPAPTASPKAAVNRVFLCFQCGACVPFDADRCPKCHARYVRSAREEDLEELARAERESFAPLDCELPDLGSFLVHFDAKTGMFSIVGAAANECSRCGTLVGLETDKCPICGTKLEPIDVGLVRMVSGMEFDKGLLDDADCPFCGDRVSLSRGVCPDCGGELAPRILNGSSDMVVPLVRANNIVFVHLDIQTGEVNFLQRNVAKACYEHASVRLDGTREDCPGQHTRGTSKT